MDWARPYSATWRVMRVDPDTWDSREELAGVREASVTRDGTGSRPLLESGSLTVRNFAGWELGRGWYRIEALVTQGGESVRVPVSTLLLEAVGGSVSRGRDDATVAGRSVLQPASDVRVLAGEGVPAGSDGAAWCARMLSSCMASPVVAEGSFALGDPAVFDSGTSVLDAVWDVLSGAGWCIQVDGDGTARIMERPSEPSLVLAPSAVRPGTGYELDLTSVPNVYIAVDGADWARAANDDPSSPVSISARGREVQVVDTSPTRVGGETLAAYAARRLEEESTVSKRYSYTRRWAPGVLPSSIVRAALPGAGLEGDLRVLSQRITCGGSISVEEVSGLEERLWSR